MSGVGEALKRKLGPLPVWAWALIAGIVVYWYRNKYGSTVTGTGTGSVVPTPPTPQPGQVLQPGESYYDPNTGQLTTAPGGGGATSDPSQSIDALTSAIDSALQQLADAGQQSQPSDTVSSPTVPPAAATSAGPAPGSPAGPHGAIFARSGPHEPPPRPGFRTVGIGNGRWIYIPTSVKKHAAGGKPALTVKPSRKGISAVKRSGAAVRSITGGRVGKRHAAPRPVHVTPRHAPPPPAQRAHPRPTHPVVSQPRVNQRAPATHPAPRPAPRPAPHPQPHPQHPHPRPHRGRRR